MKKIILILTLTFICMEVITAQNSLNDYKYVVVPHHFEFVKGKDAYRLNTITRFLFKKYGFDAYMAEEINAEDYKNNKCLALSADVEKANALLSTKLKIVLRNCDDEIIYSSNIGLSKSKEYEEAYRESLNKAFLSFEDIDYSYVPNENILSRGSKSDSNKEVEELKAKIAELEAKGDIKEEIVEVPTKIKKVEIDTKEEVVSENVSKIEVKKEEKVSKAIKEFKKEKDQIEKEVKATEPTKRERKKSQFTATLVGNEYQVYDENDKMIMTLFITSLPNVYIVKGKDAILFKRGANWILSETNGEQLSENILQIKF